MVLVTLAATPLVLGLGLRGSDFAQVDALRAANERLLVENRSFRAATGELTTQIASLQDAMVTLGERADLDPATASALEKLKALGAGGPSMRDLKATAPATANPEGTFDILRGLLGALGSSLESVKSRIENQQAFANATPSIWPLVGRYSSAYGKRKDPITGENDFHTGLDISAEQGVPVHSTADGTVDSAAYDGSYGNAVVLSHGFSISTRYGHLSQFAVKAGQKVKRGDVIGYVGATGRVTGAHLHYEILIAGNRINPITLLTGR